MRVQPQRPAHLLEPALGVERQLALGQVEIERITHGALLSHRRISRPKGAQHRVEQRDRRFVGAAVDRGLRLFVGELGRRAHHDAVERMPGLVALSVDMQAHRQRRPVFERAQRAQVVGDALGQHRHDAVGEIDGVAALERLAVERRPRRDVIGDVGDRDGDHEAAVVLALGVDGVVVVFGVHGVDGDEPNAAPILPMRHRRRPSAGRLSQRAFRKRVRQAMRGDRDAADRPLGVDGAEPLDDARGRRAEAALAQRAQRHEIAVLSAALHPGGHQIVAAGRALLDRLHAAAPGLQRAIDAERPPGRLVEDFDDPAGVGPAGLVVIDAQQRAGAERRVGRAVALDARRADQDAGVLALGRRSDESAVRSALDDVGDQHRRQTALARQNLAAALDGALGFQPADQRFQLNLAVSLDLERPRDLAFGDARRRFDPIGRGFAGEIGEHLFAGGRLRGSAVEFAGHSVRARDGAPRRMACRGRPAAKQGVAPASKPGQIVQARSKP